MIIHAYSVPVSASSMLLRPWFMALVLAGAIERLSGIALGVAFERDWVVLVLPVFEISRLLFSFQRLHFFLMTAFLLPDDTYWMQLAGVNRPIALAQANAILNRIDLLCEVFTGVMLYLVMEHFRIFIIS